MIKEGEPNRYIRDYIDNGGAENWKYRDKAQSLYAMADVFRHYLFSPQNETQAAIPSLVLAFPTMRVDALAAYRLIPNDIGLSYEISLNALYLDRPEWELHESLCHEMVHLFQENTPGLQPSKNGYHNQGFIDICEQVGLHPRLGSGAHWRPANGQFARLMERYGVEEPSYAVIVPPEKPKGFWWDADRGVRKGSSTLVLYTSDKCKRNPPCKIRSGRKDLLIGCFECGGMFKPQV